MIEQPVGDLPAGVPRRLVFHALRRAIEALASAIPLFLVLFAAAYVMLADAQPQAFSEPLSRTDALYFTITVFSTVASATSSP
jgi:hypothetical protein